MVRTGSGLGFALLLGGSIAFGGCAEDVEDPGFTSGGSATTTATTGGDTDVAPESSTSSTSGAAEESSDSMDASTSGNATATTGGAATTTGNGTGSAGCGDGIVSPGEQCDGADLQGFNCESMGLGTGTLACDPVMCTFDTSMCMSTTSGTSG